MKPLPAITDTKELLPKVRLFWTVRAAVHNFPAQILSSNVRSAHEAATLAIWPQPEPR